MGGAVYEWEGLYVSGRGFWQMGGDVCEWVGALGEWEWMYVGGCVEKWVSFYNPKLISDLPAFKTYVLCVKWF